MPDTDAKVLASLRARLANILTDAGPSLGVEVESGMLDVRAAAAALGLPAPADMDDLLQNGGAPALAAVIDRAGAAAQMILPAEQVRFAPLVTRPEKIICVGFNYREHAKETGTPIPSEPPLFGKFRNALSPHGGVVTLPTMIDDRFDFETELVIVIGREAKDVSEAAALESVAGYAVGNDLSARGKQTATTQFGAGKWADGFAPLGPWLTPAALVPDPNALKLTTRVNGALRQDWTTGDMIFNCRQLIAYCSSIMTLRPGDILFTGTPQGVIFGEKAPPEERRWLRAGDRIVSAIEGLGALAFTLA